MLRVAWPLFVLNTINDFVEEDTGYVSSFRTGEVWQIPAPSAAEIATLEDPAGQQAHRCRSKRAARCISASRPASTSSASDAEPEPLTTMFAANLADLEESQHRAQARARSRRKSRDRSRGFTPGVRREIWLYLLGAVLLVSVLEWVTYHRRITV